MRVSLKPVFRQTIVITGATSGIGLATARLAYRSGARLVLGARNAEALGSLREEFKDRAEIVPVDVSKVDDMERLADKALERFGRFDTWINNAGVSIYGRLEQVPVEDHRRLFETNFWGVVNGSLIAVRHLRHRDRDGYGGAIINIGSVLSDRAIPLQGMYSASKHAVKGFTDALRIELRESNAPISVTLIKPTGIDTPYPHHAKSYLSTEPTLPPPVYSAEVAARAVLFCVEHRKRELFVGGGAPALSIAGRFFPALTDLIMKNTAFALQKSDSPPRPLEQSGLFRSRSSLEESGRYPGHVMKSSLYTEAVLHPLVSGAVAMGAGLALASLIQTARGEARAGLR